MNHPSNIYSSLLHTLDKSAISLTDDVINNYSSADYIIFERTADGLFVPIFNGSDLKVNGNIMSTAIERKSLVATDSKGNKMNLTAIETTKGVNNMYTIMRVGYGGLDDDMCADGEYEYLKTKKQAEQLLQKFNVLFGKNCSNIHPWNGSKFYIQKVSQQYINNMRGKGLFV